jgi:signal transduction histidine kinase
MTETINIPGEELKNLQDRLEKLAADKSHLDLLIHMMSRLGAVSGLENTVEAMLQVILDNIGGTNLILYYFIDGDIYSTDVFGKKMKLDVIEDASVKKARENREPAVYEHDFSDTMMITPEFTKAMTWVFPLLVGTGLIGVLKMEGLHMGTGALRQQLPTFFSYAALILKNEILGHTRLRKVCDEVKQAENDLLGERNQLQTLLNFYRQAEMRLCDIESFIIEECVRISESPLGFFGFINENETLMRTHLWSEQAMEGCAVDFKPVEFALDHAGIWAEAVRNHEPVIVNDYRKPDSRKKGYPQGHVPIQRLMSIPIIKGDKAVAIVAVANKKLDYNETDLLHLSLFIESMWDVLERKKAEEEICKLNEELEQKVAARTKQLISVQEELVRKEKLVVLGRLAGVVGHEIRNPLGVMSNAVYFLKTVLPDADDVVKEYLGIISQEINNSQRIISDLLDFARTKTPQIVPVAVNTLVIQALGKCAIPENIAVQTDIPDILPQVNADPFQIGQVLQNLITNAVQAMPGGGALRIGAHLAQGPEREKLEPSTLKLETDGDFIEITVTDTGEGISPENMEKLFSPLFTTKTKGIGLGLVVCKNLTEANGGAIVAVSKSGEGATFTFTLPVEKRRG